MNFARISEQQTFDEVAQQNRRFRAYEVQPHAIYQFFTDRGVDVSRSVFVGMHPIDVDVFTGTIVLPDRRVFEFMFSEHDPSQLQWKEAEPGSQGRDSRSPLSMALRLFDDQISA